MVVNACVCGMFVACCVKREDNKDSIVRAHKNATVADVKFLAGLLSGVGRSLLINSRPTNPSHLLFPPSFDMIKHARPDPCVRLSLRFLSLRWLRFTDRCGCLE